MKRAMELSHIREKTALIHEGLRVLISQFSRERLIALGGSEKKLKKINRRRSKAR